MTYWILESPVGPGKVSAGFWPYSEFLTSWIGGEDFSETPPNPIEIQWYPETENQIRKSYYLSEPAVLMKADLVQALQEVKVAWN